MLQHNDISDTLAQISAADRARQFQAQQNAQQYGQQRAMLDANLGQQERESQRGLAGQLAGYRTQQAIANTQANAAKYPHTLQQGRFDQVFPWLQGQFNNAGGLFGQSGYNGQGQVGQQPWISDAPVYTPEQIQQQVNAARAHTAASVAGQQRQVEQKMAGQGFGSRSPLATSLAQRMAMKGLSAGTQAENDLRVQAAGENAKQVLGAQAAREGQFASRQKEEIDRNRTLQSYLSGLMASMVGMV